MRPDGVAGDRRADVREDVAEQVGRHDHVERVRMRHHPGAERVDVVLAQLDLRELGGHAGPRRHLVETLAGAGHLSNIERPSDFNDLVDQFIAILG